MIQPKPEPTLYILTLLKQNNDVYNFIRLNGRQFKSETERFAIIDTLIDNGSIAKVQGGIGQTYRLTEKGNQNLFQLCFKKVLQHMADDDNDFKQVSGILKELSIPDIDDELAVAIDIKLRQDDLVIATEESGVMINENGRQLLSMQKFGIQSSSSDLTKILPMQATNTPITKSDHKRNWILKMLSSNWTITIVGGTIAGLIIAYFVFVFKWNK